MMKQERRGKQSGIIVERECGYGDGCWLCGVVNFGGYQAGFDGKSGDVGGEKLRGIFPDDQLAKSSGMDGGNVHSTWIRIKAWSCNEAYKVVSSKKVLDGEEWLFEEL